MIRAEQLRPQVQVVAEIWRGMPAMTEANEKSGARKGAPPEKVPFMQQVLDNPFLLLFLGITIPTVLYIVWGVMEIASVPVAK